MLNKYNLNISATALIFNYNRQIKFIILQQYQSSLLFYNNNCSPRIQIFAMAIRINIIEEVAATVFLLNHVSIVVSHVNSASTVTFDGKHLKSKLNVRKLEVHQQS